MKQNAPRRIVITGVSRGLGRALVDGFATLGHSVCGCARSGQAIAELASQYPRRTILPWLNVRANADVQAWTRRVLAGGPVDLLVNNAGVINRNAPLWKVPEEEFSRVVERESQGHGQRTAAFSAGDGRARPGRDRQPQFRLGTRRRGRGGTLLRYQMGHRRTYPRWPRSFRPAWPPCR